MTERPQSPQDRKQVSFSGLKLKSAGGLSLFEPGPVAGLEASQSQSRRRSSGGRSQRPSASILQAGARPARPRTADELRDAFSAEKEVLHRVGRAIECMGETILRREGVGGRLCPRAHDLELTEGGRCDVCSTVAEGLGCRICNWDICWCCAPSTEFEEPVDPYESPSPSARRRRQTLLPSPAAASSAYPGSPVAARSLLSSQSAAPALNSTVQSLNASSVQPRVSGLTTGPLSRTHDNLGASQVRPIRMQDNLGASQVRPTRTQDNLGASQVRTASATYGPVDPRMYKSLPSSPPAHGSGLYPSGAQVVRSGTNVSTAPPASRLASQQGALRLSPPPAGGAPPVARQQSALPVGRGQSHTVSRPSLLGSLKHPPPSAPASSGRYAYQPELPLLPGTQSLSPRPSGTGPAASQLSPRQSGRLSSRPSTLRGKPPPKTPSSDHPLSPRFSHGTASAAARPSDLRAQQSVARIQTPATPLQRPQQVSSRPSVLQTAKHPPGAPQRLAPYPSSLQSAKRPPDLPLSPRSQQRLSSRPFALQGAPRSQQHLTPQPTALHHAAAGTSTLS
eukprot:gene11466-17637_t